MRESGYIFVDSREVASTFKCCHCGGSFVMQRGSGTQRGYCMCCGKVTCGAAQCDPCLPLEARLELMEGKRNRYADLLIHG